MLELTAPSFHRRTSGLPFDEVIRGGIDAASILQEVSSLQICQVFFILLLLGQDGSIYKVVSTSVVLCAEETSP